MKQNYSYCSVLISLFLTLALCQSFVACKRPVKTSSPHEELSDEEKARLKPKNTEPVPLVGIFVDVATPAAEDAQDGKAWDTAFKTIKQGINAASHGETVIVAAGTYHEHIVLNNKKYVRLAASKPGAQFQREGDELLNIEADSMATLDGRGANNSLVAIAGHSSEITIFGFVFRNVVGAPALKIVGDGDARPHKIALNNCRFENNSSPDGGAVFLEKASSISINNVDGIKNVANNSGGFLLASEVTDLSISGGRFEANKANNGGAFFFYDVKKLFLGMARLFGNKVAESGGGVYLGRCPKAEFSHLSLEKNKANDGGGLFIDESSDVSISIKAMNKNNAKNEGGGLKVAEGSHNARLSFADALISENTSKKGGAVAVVNSNNLVVSGGRFQNNDAKEWGGAFFSSGVRKLNVSDVQFNKNWAPFGGAMAFDNLEGDYEISKSSFQGNDGTQGGAVFVHNQFDNSEFKINGVLFSNNHARKNGGAAMFDKVSGSNYFVNTVFLGNVADGFGGALALDAKIGQARFYIEAGPQADKSTKFLRNQSKRDFGGGAIFAVFNPNNLPPPNPEKSDSTVQLYINNSFDFADNEYNSAGDKESSFGSFLRVTDQDITNIDKKDMNGQLFRTGMGDNLWQYVNIDGTGFKADLQQYIATQ